MNSKMTTNSQLSTSKPKKQQQQKRKTLKTKIKQTTRIGTVSQKQRSYGGLSVGMESWRNEEKGMGSKKHNWLAQNRQGRLRTV